MITSNDCKLAIIAYVKAHTAELANQFTPPEPMVDALKKANWKRWDKTTYQGITKRSFDCTPYDDQLRAYTIDNGTTLLGVDVCGE